jgi:hypothetical protein
MDVKGRDLGSDVAEAVLDLSDLDELAKIDRDRYTMVGIDLRVDGPTTAERHFERVRHAGPQRISHR